MYKNKIMYLLLLCCAQVCYSSNVGGGFPVDRKKQVSTFLEGVGFMDHLKQMFGRSMSPEKLQSLINDIINRCALSDNIVNASQNAALYELYTEALQDCEKTIANTTTALVSSLGVDSLRSLYIKMLSGNVSKEKGFLDSFGFVVGCLWDVARFGGTGFVAYKYFIKNKIKKDLDQIQELSKKSMQEMSQIVSEVLEGAARKFAADEQDAKKAPLAPSKEASSAIDEL